MNRHVSQGNTKGTFYFKRQRGPNYLLPVIFKSSTPSTFWPN